MTQHTLLTPAEAGAVLGVSDETMRRWATQQKVRHVVLPNGQVRFRSADIDAIVVPVEPTAKAAGG